MNDQAKNLLGDLFQFDRMMGKSLIKIVYFVGLFGIAVWALIALAGGLGAASYDSSAAVMGVFGAIMILVFGTLFWRLSCELWIVLFKIHDELQKSNDK